MFCRTCGKELHTKAEFCTGCGVRLPVGDKYCQNCGESSKPEAEVCVKCGVRLARATAVPHREGKSKTAAVLLAVFLTFWTWLYTYRKDAWKFWVGLGIALFNFFLIVVTIGLWAFVAWILGLGIWIWAIVDVATKSQEWYRSY